MKLKVLLMLYCLPFVLAAQNTKQFTLQKVIASIATDSNVFYGIFDSTDSYFVVYMDTIFHSPFDSTCFRANAKTWHRHQKLDCKLYLTMHDFNLLSDSIRDDSTELNIAWHTKVSMLKKQGMNLWQLSGEFFMNENDTAEYAGRYTGVFHFYFVELPDGTFKIASSQDLILFEPPILFYGYWKPFRHKELGAIPFFWSTKAPYVDNEDWIMPDLRLQPDGSQSFEKTSILSPNCAKPALDWYKK